MERGVPQLGPRIPAETLNRFWTMLAHSQGGLNPKPEKGFHNACADLKPDARYLVYSGTEDFPVTADIVAISLAGLAQRLGQAC